jgi:hypothetical protein
MSGGDRLSKEELAELVKEVENTTKEELKENFFSFFKTNKHVLRPCVS